MMRGAIKPEVSRVQLTIFVALYWVTTILLINANSHFWMGIVAKVKFVQTNKLPLFTGMILVFALSFLGGIVRTTILNRNRIFLFLAFSLMIVTYCEFLVIQSLAKRDFYTWSKFVGLDNLNIIRPWNWIVGEWLVICIGSTVMVKAVGKVDWGAAVFSTLFVSGSVRVIWVLLI